MVGNFSVSCLFRMEEDGFQWVFFQGCMARSRRVLENPFGRRLARSKVCGRSMVCGGDFNEILSPEERSEGGRISNSMRRFADILNDMGLRDLPLQGGPFTWRVGLNGRSKSRLDRFVVSADWESLLQSDSNLYVQASL